MHQVEAESRNQAPCSFSARKTITPPLKQLNNLLPLNPLLLIRSRSSPYKSSSLFSRFWSSPLRNEETESTSDNEKSGSQLLNRDFVYDKKDSICTTERFSSVRDLKNVEELLLKGRVKKE
ncbi:hypothetical protein RYX36_001031 [Vicia faba]